MTNILLIQAILFILLAIIQFFMSVAANLAVEDRRDRWVFTVFLFSIGLANLVVVLYLAEVTAVSRLWLTMRLGLTMVNPFLVMLFCFTVLRRAWVRPTLIIVIAILASIPVFGLLADSFGYSQQLVGQALIGVLPNTFNLELFDVLNMLQYATGPMGLIFSVYTTRGLLVSMVLFCLITSILDWRKNRYQAITGLILAFALLVIAFTAILGSVLENGAWYFLAGQYVFSFGLAYMGLRYNHEVFSLRGFGTLIADWPMLNKLLLVTLGIVIPAILLLSISALLFFQATFIESSGRDLQLIAEGRAGDLHDELSDESSKLQNLASDPFTQSLLNSRAANYAALTDDEIVQQLRAGEQTWQAGEDNNEFVTAILSSARNQHLLEFQRLFPEHQTLILADQHGGTVTATGYVENYGWSRAIWWQIVSQNAFPYIGFAQSSANSVILEIAVPINVDSDPSEIEGVLLSRFDFTDTMVNLYQFEAAESIGLALFEADWVWVAPPRDILRQSDPNLDRVVIASDPAQNWQVMAYNNENSIVAFAPIQRNINQIGTLTWRVVAYEAADVALGPISDARWGALVIGGSLLLLSVLVTLLLARLIVRPLIELSTLAGRIEAGERELDFPETGKDEIGLLATSFRTMVQELNRVVSGLEESVQTRTEDLEKRALQLETSSLVAREAASIRELETLLNSVTELITDRFGFYHTGIFLLDEDGEYAVLRAANSPGGQRMLSRGHKLQVGKVGVVGYAAGVAEPRLAQDVGADVVYYDNPDMPDTRSELALPMKVRDRVIGVLDVQSTRANAFTREDIEILENLTDQIALAIDNARLLESSQRAIEELQYLYGQRAAQAWRQRLTNEPLELYYDASGIRRQPLQVDDVNRIAGPVMYQDIVFRGQVIGTIELERENAQQTWTSEEQALVSEIIEQTALALENARLVDQIRLRSDQIQLLQEVTAISASLKDESEMLGDVAQRLQDGLGLYYVGVMLLDHEQGESRAAATACAPEAPSLNALAETRFPIKGNKVLAEILRTQETTILTNLGENSFAQASYYQHYRNAPTLVIAPLIARNELLGTLELALSDPARRLDDEELNLLEQITAQLSTALDGTRLFSQTASRAERERLVAEITTKVRASNDPGTIIETAVRELRKALNAKHAQIIFDGEGENGDGSVQANGHGDPLVDEDSAEATEQEHSSD